MSEMVERVARALWADELARNRIEPETDGFEFLPEDFQTGYRELARAAIEAMREPTEGMAEVGNEVRYDSLPATEVWERMIAAALKP